MNFHRTLFLALIVGLPLYGCDSAPEQISKAKDATRRADAPEMPKIEGCVVERYLVGIPSPAAPNTESVYIARCQPTKTVTTSMTRNCGKNCTQKVTTITTTDGVPEETK